MAQIKKRTNKKTPALQLVNDSLPEPTTVPPSGEGKFDYGDSDIMINDAASGDILIDEVDVKQLETDSLLNISDAAHSPQKPEKEYITAPAAKTTTASQKNKTQAVSSVQTYNRLYVNSASAEQYYKKLKLIERPETRLYNFKEDSIPNYPDRVYRERLQQLPTEIAMVYNDQVKAFIDMYMVHKRDQVRQMLARTELYFPIFEAALDRHGLPMELKYLPIIESALIPHAKSEDGSAGLWQLPYDIARRYGLEANTYIDERFDPALSTEAAVKYLKHLYRHYHDWHMVIAAYHCGEGQMEKTIKRSGDITNYWELSSFLPAEKRAYVPLFIAATYVMNHYPEHNIFQYNAPYHFYTTDTIMVNSLLDLQKTAQFIDMSLEELRFLNPAVKANVIPFSRKGYPIVLPVSKIGIFESYLRNLRSKHSEIVLDRREYTPTLPPDNVWNYEMNAYDVIKPDGGIKSDDGSITTSTIISYTVQRGELLTDIAKRYNCDPKDVMRWNRMDNLAVKPGDLLILYPPLKIDQPLPSPTPAPPSKPGDDYRAPAPEFEEYKVRKGDSLYTIAKKYSGVSAENIKDFNNLESIKLKVGMKLLIPHGDEEE